MLISFPLLDITSAVTPVAFKSNSPGSTAVSVIPFDWSREVGFFFYARRQLLAPLGHGTLNKNQGICIIHYSRCGAERRHRCPGHCGRTSMSKKPKVKRKKKKITYNLFLNLFLFLCNQQLTSLFRACTISCSTGFFSQSFFLLLVFFLFVVLAASRFVCDDVDSLPYCISCLWGLLSWAYTAGIPCNIH